MKAYIPVCYQFEDLAFVTLVHVSLSLYQKNVNIYPLVIPKFLVMFFIASNIIMEKGNVIKNNYYVS